MIGIVTRRGVVAAEMIVGHACYCAASEAAGKDGLACETRLFRLRANLVFKSCEEGSNGVGSALSFLFLQQVCCVLVSVFSVPHLHCPVPIANSPADDVSRNARTVLASNLLRRLETISPLHPYTHSDLPRCRRTPVSTQRC